MAPDSERQLVPTRLEPAIAALRVDQVTAEIVRSFRDAGVRSILLKGPSIATWLYTDGSHRGYVDTDLLVPPDDHAAAEAALRRLGFEIGLADEDTPGWRMNAHEWTRQDGARVDLHRTLVGVGAGPGVLWETFAAHSQPMRVGGVEVEVLSLPARALHVALHAAQHGTRADHALEDLARALETIESGTWTEAAMLARRLDAVPAFAGGLRLAPLGADLADQLGLPIGGSREVALRAGAPPRGALGLEEVARAQGLTRKLKLIARNVVPPPRFMRAWSELARRGTFGLAAAYLIRPLAILLRAGPAFIAWLRARSESASRPQP